MLPAATYPQQVAEAAQWLANNPGVTQPAIDAQPWDPSIKAILHYPTVLQKMASDMNWTQTLGVAFLNQQADVMASIQRVRAQAESAGVLTSTPQQQVETDNGDIYVEPTDQDEVYVPAYTPVYTNGIWGFGGFLIGPSYLGGIWLDNCFDWDHHWVAMGGGWRNHWRVGDVGGGRGSEISRPWRRDNRQPMPVFPRDVQARLTGRPGISGERVAPGALARSGNPRKSSVPWRADR